MILVAAMIAGCSGGSRVWPLHSLSVPAPSLSIGSPARAITPVVPIVETLPHRLRRAGPGWHRIGESVEQRPIEATLIGNGPQRVLFIGGIHGDEPEGLPLIEWFTEEMRASPALTNGVTVLVVRNLNPDGTAANSRMNQRGVDLNRNFPAANWDAAVKTARFNPGPKPESEPETRVGVRVVREFAPQRVLVMHATSGKPMNNYDGPGLELAQMLSDLNRYKVSDTIGYPTPGSLGSWVGTDLQIPIITLELPRKIEADKAWSANKAALRRMLKWESM